MLKKPWTSSKSGFIFLPQCASEVVTLTTSQPSDYNLTAESILYLSRSRPFLVPVIYQVMILQRKRTWGVTGARSLDSGLRESIGWAAACTPVLHTTMCILCTICSCLNFEFAVSWSHIWYERSHRLQPISSANLMEFSLSDIMAWHQG